MSDQKCLLARRVRCHQISQEYQRGLTGKNRVGSIANAETTDPSRPSRFLLGCLLAGVLLFAIVLTPTQTAARSAAETAVAQPVYDFGVVPQFAPRQLAAKWRPLLDDLHRRTGLNFRLIGAPQIPAFEKAFAAGAFDFSYMNPLHAMIAMRWGLYVPLVRDGGKRLQGFLVVAKTNPIQSVRDLEGRPVAYPAPNALGASLALRAELLTKFGVKTRPMYVKTHTSVYLHVALG